MRAATMAAAFLAMAGTAQAEVVSKSASGFRLQNTVAVAAPAAKAYAALGQIGSWWDSAHTYTGKASNMSMALKPGACFCEMFPDGSGIEHGRVIMAWPEQGMVRINGALGPLQDEGVSGALTFTVKPVAAGGVEIVQTYNVGGARPETVEMAALVDSVIATQLKRLKAYIETGKPS